MEILILIGAGFFAVAAIARHIYRVAKGISCYEQCKGCTYCKSNVDKKNL